MSVDHVFELFPGAPAGVSLMPRISWIVGSLMKDWRCGSMLAFLEMGLHSLIQERRDEKAPFGSKTMGIFDMLVVRGQERP